jgi:ArsR family transcriptional regulator
VTQPLLDLAPFEDHAAVFKGLSDPTRVAILSLLLLQHEMCVCDIESVLGVTQSRCSRHLRYLANAGLVTAKRLGPWMHYRIASDVDPMRRAVIEALRTTLPGPSTTQLRERLSACRRRMETTKPCVAPKTTQPILREE